MPHPNSSTVDDGVRMLLKRGFVGAESHSAKRGVTFHNTVFLLDYSFMFFV